MNPAQDEQPNGHENEEIKSPVPPGSSSTSGKKFIDPKYFDKEKGSQCFRCHKWGHRIRDCPEKVCGAVRNTPSPGKNRHKLDGFVGVHACSIVLDSGADSMVIAEDLVPEAAYTGATQHIAGVHAVGCDMLLANMKITIGG